MLSLAAIACDTEGRMLGEFGMNLDPLPGATTHPIVMEFWARNGDVERPANRFLETPA